jgi:hypothetical protein
MQDENSLDRPLKDLAYSAAYMGFASKQSLSSVLSRGTYPILNEEVVYIGQRPHFKLSTLDKFIESRTGRKAKPARNKELKQ